MNITRAFRSRKLNSMRKQDLVNLIMKLEKAEGEPDHLRDRFAMAALAGMISTAGAPCLSTFDGIEKLIAKTAYGLADAMLERRKVKT